jgi:SAM-dependent methyltransferase
MNQDLQQHYLSLFREHGDAARAVQHHDAASQANRFDVLAAIASDLGAVVDLGCGLGHLCDHLRARGFTGPYLGLDFVEEFVARASARHDGDARTQFRVFDLARDPYPKGYDTYLVCGVFNNRMPDNDRFMRQVLAKSFAAARRQVAFNAMSTYVDFENPELYYTDPREVFDYCKRTLTRRVSLRHDYLVRDDRPPYEYTMYLYR